MSEMWSAAPTAVTSASNFLFAREDGAIPSPVDVNVHNVLEPTWEGCVNIVDQSRRKHLGQYCLSRSSNGILGTNEMRLQTRRR